MNITKEEVQNLIDDLEYKIYEYVTATENISYFKGKIDGIEDSIKVVKNFFK